MAAQPLMKDGEVHSGYKLEGLIGSGAFGEVWKATAPDGKLVAAKFVHCQDKEQLLLAVKEAETQRALKSHHVVQVLDIPKDCIIERFPFVCFMIVMELLASDFVDTVKNARKLTIKEKMSAINEISAGIAFVHSFGAIHRDIKPENILVGEDGRPRLADFGLVRLRESLDEQAYTIAGTLHYIAPEILSQKGYVEKTDIWSLGCLFFELALGSRLVETTKPFAFLPPEDFFKLFEMIKEYELQQVCSLCLQADPSQRISADGLTKLTRPVTVHANFQGERRDLVTYSVCELGYVKEQACQLFGINPAQFAVTYAGDTLASDTRLWQLDLDQMEFDFSIVAKGDATAIAGDRIVKIVGSILDVEADAMVVSHNNFYHWSFSAGLQPKLLKAMGQAGNQVERSTSALIAASQREKGGFPVGTVVDTVAGDLPVKTLLHLVTITYKKRPSNNVFQFLIPHKTIKTKPDALKVAIHNALDHAEELGLTSVSIPSLMAFDHMTIPNNKITELVEESCKSWDSKKNVVKEIKIVEYK